MICDERVHQRRRNHQSPYRPLPVSLGAANSQRKVSLMSGIENANGTSGERGKERHVLLMHPQSSVVFGLRHFYPFGELWPLYYQIKSHVLFLRVCGRFAAPHFLNASHLSCSVPPQSQVWASSHESCKLHTQIAYHRGPN